MSENWQVFKVSELNSIAFECPHCKTTIAFTADNEIICQQQRMCPGCNREVPGVGIVLDLYRRLQREAQRVPVVLRARIG